MDEATIIANYRDIVQGKQAENEQLKKEKEELARRLEIAEGKLSKKDREALDLASCTVCFFVYNQHYRLPVVGSCGHTICNRCAQSLRKVNLSCPTCRAVNSFNRPVKNFLAHDLLEHSNSFPVVENNTIMATCREEIVILNKDRTKWIKIAVKVPLPECENALLYLNGEIYLLVGYGILQALYKLDKNLKWIRLADMNIGRKWIENSCLAWNGYIWVFGGADEQCRPIKTVERYDPKTNKWTLMPGTKEYRAAVLCNNRIITYCKDHVNETNSVQYYNPEDGSGTKLPDLPSPIYYAEYPVCYNNKIISIGSTIGNYQACLWELDPQETNSKWYQLPSTKYTEEVWATVTLDCEIYVLCSRLGKTNNNRVEIFDGAEWREGPEGIDGISAVIIPQNLADRLCNYKPQ